MNTDCSLCVTLLVLLSPIFLCDHVTFSPHDFNSHNSPLFTSKIFLTWSFKFILFLSVLLAHNFLISTKLYFSMFSKFHTPKTFTFPFSSLFLALQSFKTLFYILLLGFPLPF